MIVVPWSWTHDHGSMITGPWSWINDLGTIIMGNRFTNTRGRVGRYSGVLQACRYPTGTQKPNFYTDTQQVYRNPITIETPNKYTEILLLYRRPTFIQTPIFYNMSRFRSSWLICFWNLVMFEENRFNNIIKVVLVPFEAIFNSNPPNKQKSWK